MFLAVAQQDSLLAAYLNLPAAPATFRAVIRVGVIVALLVAFVLPFRTVHIGLLTGPYVIYGIALVSGYALAGLLLAWWSARSSNRGVALLSATYLFSAIMVLGNVSLILEPNRSPNGGQASLWLWLLWHVGLPLGILASTQHWIALDGGLRSAAAAAFSATGAALLLAWFASSRFPLSQDGQLTPLFHEVSAATAVVVAFALRQLWRTGRSSALDLLLALVLLSVAVDLALVWSSPMGYSIGTYTARVMGLLSGLIVSATFVRWMMASIERSDLFAQYAVIAESAPSITFLLDESGQNAIYMNGRWSELTGQPAQQALGKGWQAFVHPDDLLRRIGPDWRLTEENQVQLRDREGNYALHLVRYGVVRNRASRQVGWVGTLWNIERERQALDESRRLAQQLHEQVRKEREIAAALRAAVLPAVAKPDFDGVHFSTVYRPMASADDIGGDWNDRFVLPDGIVVLTVGDVSGHGLSVAASMLRLRESLRMAAFSEKGPALALGVMNRMLTMEDDLYATALVAFFDPHGARMVISVAGHPAPVLIRSGVADALPVRGTMLGASESGTFEDVTLSLEPGDQIAFYTDGLIDAGKAPLAGEQRLLDALREAGAVPLESLADRLLSEGQTDDATLILLSYRADWAVSWHFRSDNADSAQSARAAFCYHLVRNGVDPDAIGRAELVFGELVGNVVRHAPGPIEISLAFTADDAVLWLRDLGPGFDAHQNVLPPEPLAEGVAACSWSRSIRVPRRSSSGGIRAGRKSSSRSTEPVPGETRTRPPTVPSRPSPANVLRQPKRCRDMPARLR